MLAFHLTLNCDTLYSFKYDFETADITWLYRCLIANGLCGRSGDLGITGHTGTC